MMIKAHISFHEYLKLMFRLAYRKPVMIAIVTFDLLMAAWIIAFYCGADSLPEPEYPQYMAIFLISVVQPIGIYISIRQNYESSSRLHERIEIELTPEKLIITGKSFYSEHTWKKEFRVLELNDWILVYENNFAATIIPKRLLKKREIEDFREFLEGIPHIQLRLKKTE
jgi:hypothetical protein